MVSQSVSRIGNAMLPTKLLTFILKYDSTEKHPRTDQVSDSSSVCLASDSASEPSISMSTMNSSGYLLYILFCKYVCMYV